MAYVVPSVLVYQILANAGGVANVTPDLDALIVGPCYNVVPYVAGSAASLILTSATDNAGAAFTLTDNTVNNVVNLPSQTVGQVVETTSLVMYMNASKVQTVFSQFTGTAGSNVATYSIPAGVTGTATASSATLTAVSNATAFSAGDPVTVTGAGASGAALVTTVVSTTSTTVVVADPASTTAAATALTKGTISNTNAATSTLRVEAGDAVVITYSSTTFTTTVLSVSSTTGTITTITLADILPSGITSPFTLSVRKTYNNLVLPITYNAYTNYDLSAVGATGRITIRPLPKVGYGTIVSGEVHVDYRALRTDLAGTIQDITDIADLKGTLGSITDANPLALGVELALANTTGRIKALAVASDDLAGYVGAFQATENARVYAIVPLTQDSATLASLQTHVDGMSTPENAAWRIGLVNTAIPTIKAIGPYNVNSVNANSGNNAITLVSGAYILTASNAQFLSDGAIPGDTVTITASTGSPTQVGAVKILAVLNNQQVQIAATGAATAVSYYVTRTLTKSQQADTVAAVSRTFKDKRMLHVQPDSVGVSVNGVTKYLPGYYVCAALAGLISGLPVQQGLTNIGVAGVSDLQHSNFYFTRAQLGTMAQDGTWLMVQEAQGTIPYTRHELTTDMSVLQYREVQQVKNIDFLSYYFHDIFKGFIGKWNITPDSLNTLRQTFNAAGKQLQGKKLPMIGAPLVDFSVQKLEQDAVNTDNVNAVIPVKIPTVMNYINIYLVS